MQNKMIQVKNDSGFKLLQKNDSAFRIQDSVHIFTTQNDSEK